MTIAGISVAPNVQRVEPLKLPVAPPSIGNDSFQNVLQSAIADVDRVRGDAETKIGNFLSGEGAELHDVILSTQRAELSFELFTAVRNKVVQSYQEIMRMQL